MELNWADAIDTACTGCGAFEAVDWVQVKDGTRRYACESCLEELLRYDTAESLEALEDTPMAVVCPACERLTLQVDVGPANRCPDCAPEDNQEVLEQAQQVIAGPGPQDEQPTQPEG